MNDKIGSAHMTQGNLTKFNLNRFGNQNSALALNGGWTQVPAGIYFDTPELTISAWVYPQQVSPWARLLDFGNGPGKDSIHLTLDSDNNNRPFGYLSPFFLEIKSSSNLILNQWQLLTGTFDGQTFSIYINGTLSVSGIKSSIYSQMPRLHRALNYVGKSSWDRDGYSYSYIDDLRFYNKSLTQSQISELMLLKDENNITACKTTTTTKSTKLTASSSTTPRTTLSG
jgi:hypothetical protein